MLVAASATLSSKHVNSTRHAARNVRERWVGVPHEMAFTKLIYTLVFHIRNALVALSLNSSQWSKIDALDEQATNEQTCMITFTSN
jgi:hypothetical protein